MKEPKVTLPAQEQKVAAPSQEPRVTLPAQEQKVAAPSQEPRVTLPAQESKVAAPAQEQKVAALAKEAKTPSWFARFFVKKRSNRNANECLTSATLNKIRANVVDKLDKNVTDEVADVLSAVIGIGQRIRSRDLYIDDASSRLEFIISCALQEKPQLILARDELLRIQLEIYKNSPFFVSRWLSIISAGSSGTLVVSALVASLFVWGIIALSIRILIDLNTLGVHMLGLNVAVSGYDGVNKIAKDVLFMDERALLVVTSAAFVGGVVSIATRLGQFSQVQGLDPFAMFWTAVLKPLIGVVLSVFILAALSGEIIGFGFLGPDPLGLTTIALGTAGTITAKTAYVLWVIGFLAGFSERFAWDFVERTEGTTSGNAGRQPQNRED
jgi:hypothetical protein